MPLAGDKNYIMGNSRQDNSLHQSVKTTMQTTNNLTWEVDMVFAVMWVLRGVHPYHPISRVLKCASTSF